MGKSREAVVAAIPTYNRSDGAEGLLRLLDVVGRQNYSDVFIPIDGPAGEITAALREHRGEVKIVSDGRSLGPAGNRNRVKEHAGMSIIHYMDDDTVLGSAETPEIIQDLFCGLENVGYVGGLVRNKNGRQMPANYGPQFSFLSQWPGQSAQGLLYELGDRWPRQAVKLRGKLHFLLKDWPDTEQEPEPELKQVFGATEANLMVRAREFRSFGGFDPRLRFFEGAELAVRMERAGLPRYFYPLVDVTHDTDIGLLEGIRRLPTMVRWSVPVIGSVGVKNYILSR